MGWRFKGNELKYLKEVAETDFKSSASGSMVERFEKLAKKTFGTSYAIASTSCTAALHQALAACGIGPGDEVIIPALTVVMCGYAPLQLGAKLVFADVCPDTFLINPDDIERKITPKTKAIMAVHLYGQMCEMDRIMEIAKKYNLWVIEDCAECYLASDDHGRIAGTIGHVGCFSLSDTKTITSGEGGLCVTQNKILAERIRKFGYIGFKNTSAEGGAIRIDPMIFQDPSYLRHDTFAHCYMMSEFTAAVALAQLERIRVFTARRTKMGNLYRKTVENCSWLTPQQITPGFSHVYWTFVARYTGDAKIGIPWKEFRNKFIEFGGDKVRAAWALVYREPSIQNFMKNGLYFCDNEDQSVFPVKGTWQEPDCPVAEEIQPQLMHFTTNQSCPEEMKRQAEALKRTIDYFNK